MRNVTLRQLRVFEAVARHMNFSRAAEELHLSQPAVSTQIKELAAHVGLPLFERLGRKTYLTPAGDEMLHCARSITQRIRETEDAVAQLKGVTGGRLNVAVISAGDSSSSASRLATNPSPQITATRTASKMSAGFIGVPSPARPMAASAADRCRAAARDNRRRPA